MCGAAREEMWGYNFVSPIWKSLGYFVVHARTKQIPSQVLQSVFRYNLRLFVTGFCWKLPLPTTSVVLRLLSWGHFQYDPIKLSSKNTVNKL